MFKTNPNVLQGSYEVLQVVEYQTFKIERKLCGLQHLIPISHLVRVAFHNVITVSFLGSGSGEDFKYVF